MRGERCAVFLVQFLIVLHATGRASPRASPWANAAEGNDYQPLTTLTNFCLCQRDARSLADPTQSEVARLRQALSEKDERIKMLLDESVDRATQLGLELDAKKDALAIATKNLEESEKKRIAAESALDASQLKFSGIILSEFSNYLSATRLLA